MTIWTWKNGKGFKMSEFIKITSNHYWKGNVYWVKKIKRCFHNIYPPNDDCRACKNPKMYYVHDNKNNYTACGCEELTEEQVFAKHKDKKLTFRKWIQKYFHSLGKVFMVDREEKRKVKTIICPRSYSCDYYMENKKTLKNKGGV